MMKPCLGYVVSFIPSFVENEILALNNMGIDTQVVVMQDNTKKKDGTWSDIIGGIDKVIPISDERSKVKKIWRVLSNCSRMMYKGKLKSYQAGLLKLVRLRADEKINRYYIRYAMMIAVAIAEKKIYRIHTHFAWDNAAIAAHVAELLSVPFSLTVHANDIYALNDDEKRFVKKLFDKADRIITISRFNRNYLLNNFSDSSTFASKIRVVHCGINIEKFASLGSLPSLDDKIKIATLPSGFVEKKGLGVLFEAIKILKNSGVKIQCIILGGRPDDLKRAGYEERARELGISDVIHFAGLIPQKNLNKIYGDCNVFVLPCIIDSGGKMDGIPVSLIEAMALGLPAISTDVSGIPELIEHGENGFLVEPKNSDKLAKQLIAIKDMKKEELEEIKCAARKKVMEEFNITITVRNLIEVLDIQLR